MVYQHMYVVVVMCLYIHVCMYVVGYHQEFVITIEESIECQVHMGIIHVALHDHRLGLSLCCTTENYSVCVFSLYRC